MFLSLPWPAHFADITIIENVWIVLECRVQKRVNEIKNNKDLMRIVIEIWADLPLHFMRSLYHSIPRRIRDVLIAKCHISKY